MELDIVLKLQERLSKALEELAEMQAKAISVSTSRLDGLPRATALTSRTENFIVTLADAERRICDLRIEIELKRLALGFEIIERVKGKAQVTSLSLNTILIFMGFLGVIISGKKLFFLNALSGTIKIYQSRIHGMIPTTPNFACILQSITPKWVHNNGRLILLSEWHAKIPSTPSVISLKNCPNGTAKNAPILSSLSF